MEPPLKTLKNPLNDGQSKICGGCDERLPLDRFTGRPGTGRTASKCKECLRWEQIFRSYGMTRDDWYVRYNEQEGKCAVCFTKLEHDHPSLNVVVDHDHATGAFRGIACRACNVTLAQIEKIGTRFFQEYLDRAAANGTLD